MLPVRQHENSRDVAASGTAWQTGGPCANRKGVQCAPPAWRSLAVCPWAGSLGHPAGGGHRGLSWFQSPDRLSGDTDWRWGGPLKASFVRDLPSASSQEAGHSHQTHSGLGPPAVSLPKGQAARQSLTLGDPGDCPLLPVLRPRSRCHLLRATLVYVRKHRAGSHLHPVKTTISCCFGHKARTMCLGSCA